MKNRAMLVVHHMASSFVTHIVRIALIFGAIVGGARADVVFSTDFSAQDIGSSPYPAYNPGTSAPATVLVQLDPVSGSRSLDFTSQTAANFAFGTPPGSSDPAAATAAYNYYNSFVSDSNNSELNAYYQGTAESYYYAYLGDSQHSFLYTNLATPTTISICPRRPQTRIRQRCIRAMLTPP